MYKEFELLKGFAPLKIKFIKSKFERNIVNQLILVDNNDLIFDNICRKLKIQDYSIENKFVIIYKLREFSYGDSININYKCKNCKKAMTGEISISNIISHENVILENEINKDFYNTKELDIEKLKITDAIKFFNKEINTADDAFELYRELISRIPNYNNVKTNRCIFCNEENEFNLFNKKFCIETLTEYKPLDFIKMYQMLVFNGFSIKDIDELYPYEREMHYQIIVNKLEKKDNV